LSLYLDVQELPAEITVSRTGGGPVTFAPSPVMPSFFMEVVVMPRTKRILASDLSLADIKHLLAAKEKMVVLEEKKAKLEAVPTRNLDSPRSAERDARS
jgi:hypothetical protein